MKKFSFTLERVREWREKQIAMEESRLEKLLSELAAEERRREALEKEAVESTKALTQARSIDYVELQAIDAFHRYVVAQRVVIAAAIEDAKRRITEQQLKVMEARRRFELLDKLKQKKWKAWNAELSREIEEQAGEAFLAQWGRMG